MSITPGTDNAPDPAPLLVRLQELHAPDSFFICAECDVSWPCSTADLVYSVDEIDTCAEAWKPSRPAFIPPAQWIVDPWVARGPDPL